MFSLHYIIYFCLPSCGVRISLLGVGGPRPIVPTLTEQLYTVYDLKPVIFKDSCEEDMFRVSVGRTDIRVTM